MKKGRLCINSALTFFFPLWLLFPLNCSNIIPSSFTPSLSHTSTHTPADCGSQHQSVMEGGTSLAGEDRGEGGWNHLGDAVERELLRLSGWGKRGWRERERRGGWWRGEKGERKGTNDRRKKKSTWASKIMSGNKTKRAKNKQEESH